jgi:hypothetical protein
MSAIGVSSLIDKEVIKIIEEGCYLAVLEKFDLVNRYRAMTLDYDTHLTIDVRHYNGFSVVSAYSWFEKADSYPHKTAHIDHNTGVNAFSFLEQKQIFDAPPCLNIIKHWSEKECGFGKYKDDQLLPTAFFRIDYSNGEDFRVCFKNLRDAIIGNLLVSRAA